MLQILLWKTRQTRSLSFLHPINPCSLPSSSCTCTITVASYLVSLLAASRLSSETVPFTTQNLQWLPTVYEKKVQTPSLGPEGPPGPRSAFHGTPHSPVTDCSGPLSTPQVHLVRFYFHDSTHMIVSITNPLLTALSFAISLRFHSEVTFCKKSALIL